MPLKWFLRGNYYFIFNIFIIYFFQKRTYAIAATNPPTPVHKNTFLLVPLTHSLKRTCFMDGPYDQSSVVIQIAICENIKFLKSKLIKKMWGFSQETLLGPPREKAWWFHLTYFKSWKRELDGKLRWYVIDQSGILHHWVNSEWTWISGNFWA